MSETGWLARAERAFDGQRDVLVGPFGWRRRVYFADIEGWMADLARAARGLEPLPSAPARSRSPSWLADAPFDELGDAWHAAYGALQAGVRAVALARHYLPVWGARRADARVVYSWLSDAPCAVVVAGRPAARDPDPPLGVFALPRAANAPAIQLQRRLDAVEALLDRAGEMFQLAGRGLDAIRRRREPARHRELLLHAATLATARPRHGATPCPS